MWQNDASTLVEEKLRKLVRFEVDEEVGDDPMLPLGLTLFSVEDAATEQEDAPGSPTQVLMDYP